MASWKIRLTGVVKNYVSIGGVGHQLGRHACAARGDDRSAGVSCDHVGLSRDSHVIHLITCHEVNHISGRHVD